MPNPLVECIPNFSEACRPEVIEQILASIRLVNGINILDHHSDLDHNRTVVTFVGAPKAIEEAAFQAIRTAADLINLDLHTGEHPRLGATDVVPFVPIRDITLQECVEIARRVGKRVGEELSIPVYLYESAATRPDRQNLENIRHGEYEALKKELGINPDRDPDYGPKKISPAGATIIGARNALIAFNVFLTTNDVSIAKKIAKSIRNSSGGFRFVKALGLEVDGRAQVSMNFTNFRETPVFRVLETIRSEATHYGVSVHHSELVGLIPQDALRDAAVWYLQLDGFLSNQVLEEKLNQLQIKSSPVIPAASDKEFLNQLAAGTPTPGGGSAAAFTGSTAASLVAMVARLTVGKKKYVNVEIRMNEIINQAEELREKLLENMHQDSAAFDTWIAAKQLPKNTEMQIILRNSEIEKAAKTAIEVPLQTAHLAHLVMELALECAEIGNLTAISDTGAACELANAAITAAGYNVRINGLCLNDTKIAEDYLIQSREIESASAKTLFELRKTLSTRGNIPLI